MPVTTRPPVARTAAAVAYYLARPATWWLTATRQPHPRPGTEAGQ